MEINGAIFDLDGTLLDSMGIWQTLGARYLRAKGLMPEAGLNEKLYPMSMPQAAEYFRSEYGLTLPVEMIVQENNHIVETFYQEEVALKEGADVMLEGFKSRGVRMCIATASERYLVEAALKGLNIGRYFSGIVTCNEIGCGKDSPEVFRRALTLLQTKRSDTIVFEDALHALRTAKADGFFVAAIYDESEKTGLVQEEADRYLRSWSEWEELFK